jgi:hypothetical protein
LKTEKRHERQDQAIIRADEDWMAAERLAQQRDAEAATLRNAIDEAAKAKSENRSYLFYEFILPWSWFAAVIAVVWWLVV